MSSDSGELWKRQETSQRNTASVEMIFKWVTLLNVHYKADLSEAEQKIYIEGLRCYSPDRLDAAFYRCRQECEHMPRISDIVKRLPEDYQGTAPADIGADFVPVKDWYEAHTKTHHLHIWMDQYGRKKVQQVLADAEDLLTSWPAHWSPTEIESAQRGIGNPMSWEEAKKKIFEIAESKSIDKPKAPLIKQETNYIPMVGNQTLNEWALDQDLSDTLPRTEQEIENIKAIRNYGKPKKKRRII